MQEHDSHLDGDVGATALAPESAPSIFVPGAAPSVPLKPVLFHGALLLSACQVTQGLTAKKIEQAYSLVARQ